MGDFTKIYSLKKKAVGEKSIVVQEKIKVQERSSILVQEEANYFYILFCQRILIYQMFSQTCFAALLESVSL